MEVYIYEISKVRKHKVIARHYIQECIDSMEHFIRSSTRFFFENNEYYKELPQNLKHKLVRAVLHK